MDSTNPTDASSSEGVNRSNYPSGIAEWIFFLYICFVFWQIEISRPLSLRHLKFKMRSLQKNLKSRKTGFLV